MSMSSGLSAAFVQHALTRLFGGFMIAVRARLLYVGRVRLGAEWMDSSREVVEGMGGSKAVMRKGGDGVDWGAGRQYSEEVLIN